VEIRNKEEIERILEKVPVSSSGDTDVFRRDELLVLSWE
jgi:hypothetical protein